MHSLNPLRPRLSRRPALGTFIARVAESLGVSPDALAGRSRVGPALRARQLAAYLWVERLGRPASGLARALNWSRGHATWAAQHGAKVATPWRASVTS